MVKTMSTPYELMEQVFLHKKPNSELNMGIGQIDKEVIDKNDEC
jgi:hypothetical protein